MHGNLTPTILLVFMGLVVLASLPLVYALTFQPHLLAEEEEEIPTWRLGNGLVVGDSYSYRVCGSVHAIQEIYPAQCYELALSFVHVMDHHTYGRIWVVAVEYSVPATVLAAQQDPAIHNTKRTIMFLDDHTMRIHPTSAWDRPMAASIQNTVLHLSSYGLQPINMGAHWGDMAAYFYDVPLSVLSVSPSYVSAQTLESAKTYVLLGYEVASVESNTILDTNKPFPVYSRWYDPNSVTEPPRLLHEYQMTYGGDDTGYEDTQR